jgi:hypothetical protein
MRIYICHACGWDLSIFTSLSREEKQGCFADDPFTTSPPFGCVFASGTWTYSGFRLPVCVALWFIYWQPPVHTWSLSSWKVIVLATTSVVVHKIAAVGLSEQQKRRKAEKTGHDAKLMMCDENVEIECKC